MTDFVFLLLAVGTVVLAVLGVRRSRRWADRRRPGPAAVARLAPYLLPLALMLTLHRAVSFLYRGQDISWLQTVYLYPAFTVLLAAGALACLVVVAARLIRWTHPG
ncbi:hypothetical protein [Micromonospora luteifusca]|uniref:hypothetical protein n=1 Tax=Micromonospora luteifusca TaxID=709860 RepID=UPI0033A65783